jgi:hypothetical protein
MNPMRIFGVESHPHLEVVKTPVLDENYDSPECCWCEERIKEGEIGFIMDCYDVDGVKDVYYHRECLMRTILGSVGHQAGACSCNGGEGCGDPPGLTRREAARAAWAYKEREQND